MTTAIYFFESEAGIPNLATWPSGTVPVTVWAKIETPGSETCTIVPRLYRGQTRAVYVPYDTGTLYDPPTEVSPQTLTEDWALYSWSVPVQELTGPTSDRFFFQVIGSCVNSGPIFHVGSDGGDNQTKAETQLTRQAYQPPSLRRNPDSARPTRAITVGLAGGVSQPVGTFYSLAGDPGLAIWNARTWRLRIWAKVDTGSANMLASIGRKAAGGGVTYLAAGIAVGTVTTTGWTLFRVDVAVPASSGATDDVMFVGLTGQAAGTVSLSVAVGLDHPSSINAPLLAPAGGTPTAPTDDHKVSVDGIGTPGYLANVVQSGDGSIAMTVDSSSHKLDIRASGYLFRREHRPMGTATDADGMVTLPTIYNSARLELSIPFLFRIDATGFGDGDEATLLITNATPSTPKTISDGASGSDPFVAISLPTVAGQPKPITVTGPSLLRFKLDIEAARWRLIAPITTYVVP